MEDDTVRTIEAQGPGSVLEEIARQGAKRMLAEAMELPSTDGQTVSIIIWQQRHAA